MNRKGNATSSGFLLAAVFIAATRWGQVPAHAQARPQPQPGRPPATRSSTDAPIPAQGKLGQDLFLAIGHRDLAAVRTLLKRGADPNARNGLTFVPLYIASVTGQTEVIETLLQAGANVDAASPYGTALTFAAQRGSVPVYNLLLSRGARINAIRADGTTVLMHAARAGGAPMVSDLLRRKAAVNVKDNDGATALTWAARDGQTEAGRLLLAGNATVDAADRRGWTPLMYAAVNGHAAFVQLLLDNGAKPNVRESAGRTALVLCATYGDHPEVVRALLQGGGDRNATEAEKRAAFAVAVARGHHECAGLLASSPIPAPPLHGRRSAREAVEVSLKLVQHSMLQFYKKTGCISCHHEGLGRMATGAARDRGFTLETAVERAQRERINATVAGQSVLNVQALKDPEAMKNVPLIEIDGVTTRDTWVLAGMGAHKQPATGAAGAMAMVLARQQGPEGNWYFSGPRVPMQSSFFTYTALSIKSLQDYAPRASAAEITARVNQAKIWLMTAPVKTSEDRSLRLLGLKWAGVSAPERQKALTELCAAQRPDGGWAQVATLQSDAYATGQALYALHMGGGLAVTDPVYTAGVQFLLRTQDEDGSWFVNKRTSPNNNYFDAGFPHGVSQYSSFNGTCWAILALLQTMDCTQRPASQPDQ